MQLDTYHMSIKEVVLPQKSSSENFSKYTDKGYRTGRLVFPATRVEVELLPNQFYRDNGFVDELPGAKGDEDILGACPFSLDKDTRAVIINNYLLELEDPMAGLFVRGHEEGHALLYSGNLSRLYNKTKSWRLEELFEGYMSQQLAEVLDSLIKNNTAVAMTMEGGKVSNIGERAGESIVRLIHMLNSSDKLKGVFNTSGLIAALEGGYKLDEIYEMLKHIEISKIKKKLL